MDVRETSAMTEASGVVNDQDGSTYPSGEGHGSTDGMKPRQPAARLSEQLRRLTSEAPLQALFVAFLLGFLVARRR